MKIASRLVSFDPAPGDRFRPISTPIYQTATYEQEFSDQFGEYDYSRSGNPTRAVVEKQIASLENGSHGYCFSSGMAAITTATKLLQHGDEILADNDLYGGTCRLFTKVLKRTGIAAKYADACDLENFERQITPKTKLIYVESPTNPLMVLTDIAAVAQIAHARGIEVSVDNTFMSPALQSPIKLGADIVMHSTTKFLNGHSDGLGGALIGTTPEHKERFLLVQKAAGGIMSPFEAFLVLRGIRTLPLRMRQHEENGRAVAEFLSSQPKIKRLSYPGLKSHPQYELAVRQQKGFGSMLSMDLGTRENCAKFLAALKIFLNAESLGGVESLASHSATTTHATVSAEDREAMGITEGMIRLSVGIEDKEDLIADLEQALAAF